MDAERSGWKDRFLRQRGEMAIETKSSLTEENIALRIEWEMRRRNWSQERLAAEMAKVGYPLHQSAISKIINPRPDGRRRAITVDEAIGFARVFAVPFDELPMPLDVVQGQEAHVLTGNLVRLIKRWSTTTNLIHIYWERLADLLADKEVRSGYTQWLGSVKNYTAAEARNTVETWTKRASTTENYLKFSLEGLPIEQPESPTTNQGRRDSITLTTLAAQVKNMPSWDRRSIESWLERSANDIVHHGLSQVIARLVNRQLDGRPFDQELIAARSQIDQKLVQAVHAANIAAGPEDVRYGLPRDILDHVIERYVAGDPESAIAASVGQSEKAVDNSLRLAGLITGINAGGPAEGARARRLRNVAGKSARRYSAGESIRAIAESLGLKPFDVFIALLDQGHEFNVEVRMEDRIAFTDGTL